MYKRIILMILVIGFLSCNPASAVNLVVNGDFETGDLTSWTLSHSSSRYNYTISTNYGFDSYGIKLHTWSTTGSGMDNIIISQTIDLTNVNNLTFKLNVPTITSYNYDYTDGFLVYINSNKIYRRGYGQITDGWIDVNLDVSSYSGEQVIYFKCNIFDPGTQVSETVIAYLDNIVADDGIVPPTYIVWSTWPEDSWAVGNYSMIVVGVPAPPDPVDFYIKTPSTDYIKKPLTKSPLVKTWNYEESQWYYQYFHTVYHTQYGDYSCKIVNSSADFIEYSNITVPYSSPNVPIPPVVTIPTPDPIEAPPEWNVTIPEQYENVSWIFDYTDFWDELGTTLNDTLYSTVGLIFIPMESINESVYTVYTHVDTAADMVSGSEHTNIIVQVAWNVIPDGMKTIFIGAAAIGLCIFILHRRT